MRRFTILTLAISATCFGQRAITTFAGRDVQFEDDGKPGIEARIGAPRGIALDGKGNLFFTDEGFSLVLKLDTAGRLSVLANSEQVVNPRGIAVDSEGNVYVVDAEFVRLPGASFASRFGRVRKIVPDGAVSTIAGGGSDTNGEGIPALQARLAASVGLTMDRAGNLYVADTGTNRVRRVGRDGTIRTIAGSGRSGSAAGDGGPAILATLSGPTDVAIDRDGGLLIADWQNARVRRVDLADGVIRTVAGGGAGQLGQGTATEMTLVGPYGVASAPDGGFYLFDYWALRVPKSEGGRLMPPNWFLRFGIGQAVLG